MMYQLSGILSLMTKKSVFSNAAGHRRRWGTRRSGQTSLFLLILAGLFMALPSVGFGQSDSVPLDPIGRSPVSGRPLTVEKIIPADVLARVELLREELELIRFEMGQPKEQRLEVAVTNVVPREVIFQAFTLFRKANQLRLELTGITGTEMQIGLPPNIRPFHVWTIVDAAYQVVLVGKQQLGITKSIEETLQDESVTPSDVFHAIIQASQQFNVLYRKRLSANDTFHQVMVATNVTARLLAEFPGAMQMPNTPAFEHGKRPVDVYTLLNKCYARVHAILDHSGIESLKFEMSNVGTGKANSITIRPSDVYDLSILLVSELAFLHGQLKDADAPLQSRDLAFKVPSHVYQRAELLLRQLVELETRVSVNPDWLTR